MGLFTPSWDVLENSSTVLGFLLLLAWLSVSCNISKRISVLWKNLTVFFCMQGNFLVMSSVKIMLEPTAFWDSIAEVSEAIPVCWSCMFALWCFWNIPLERLQPSSAYCAPINYPVTSVLPTCSIWCHLSFIQEEAVGLWKAVSLQTFVALDWERGGYPVSVRVRFGFRQRWMRSSAEGECYHHCARHTEQTWFCTWKLCYWIAYL